MNTTLPDTAARHTALTDLGRTLLVEAGAGTGKTALLAGRVAMMLAGGVPPARIAAVTFTEAAAAELGERIERLVRALLRGPVPEVLREALPCGLTGEQRDRLHAAANALDHITCTTIHGFCRQLLTPYPVETGLDPDATVIEPDAAERLFEECLDTWLRERLGDPPGPGTHADTAPPEPMAEPADLLRALARRAPEETVALAQRVARLLNAHSCARAPQPAPRWPRPAQQLVDAVAQLEAWYAGCGVVESEMATVIAELARVADTARAVVEEPRCAQRLATAVLHAPPGVCKRGERTFRRWQGVARWRAAARACGLDEVRGRALGTAAAAHHDTCAQAYLDYCDALGAAATHGLATELAPVRDAYRRALRAIAQVDFDELLLRARDLLRDHEAVRAALAARYSRLLVDEFQDTDPLQAEIVWRLTGEGAPGAPWAERALRPGALFLVGDPKQAVYRFRGADLDTYRTAKRALLRHDPDGVLTVSTSFRSRSPILGFVNHAFAPILLESCGQPGFTALAATRDTGARACVGAIDVALEPRPNAASRPPATDALRRAEADAVAETVARLIGAQPVWDAALARERPARPGDIALLAPSGTGLWMYERALGVRGIPVASQAGKGFHHRQEIQDLTAVVRAVADARDTLALGAVLRGPLVGLTDEAIADALEALHRRSGGAQRLNLWTSPGVVENAILRETLLILQHLASIAHRTTPYHLLCEAVERFHVRPLLRARHPRAALRALANVDLLLETARGHAGRGLADFARVLWRHWLRGASRAEARPESNDDAVALVTMHAAKGLEWPVVVPVNAVGRPRPRPDCLVRHRDATVHFRMLGLHSAGHPQAREEEELETEHERVRLWYVAMTRARDLLLLPRHPACVSGHRQHPGATHLGTLARFTPDGSGPPMPGARAAHPDTAQDAATWQGEREAMAARRRRLVWQQPSAHEDTARVALDCEASATPVAVPRESRSAPSGPPPLAAVHRGAVLHKLLEEVLTGETAENPRALRARAVALLAQLDLATPAPRAPAPPSDELAETVLRALALPEVVVLRPRLVPEVAIHASAGSDRNLALIAGVADAVVLDESGRIELVLDWKSDVRPTPGTVDSYCRQMHDYLRATGARTALLVFLSAPTVHRITV